MDVHVSDDPTVSIFRVKEIDCYLSTTAYITDINIWFWTQLIPFYNYSRSLFTLSRRSDKRCIVWPLWRGLLCYRGVAQILWACRHLMTLVLIVVHNLSRSLRPCYDVSAKNFKWPSCLIFAWLHGLLVTSLSKIMCLRHILSTNSF